MSDHVHDWSYTGKSPGDHRMRRELEMSADRFKA